MKIILTDRELNTDQNYIYYYYYFTHLSAGFKSMTFKKTLSMEKSGVRWWSTKQDRHYNKCF